MKNSLYAKMAFVLLGLFIAIGISLVVISVVSTEKYQQEVKDLL